MALRCSSRFQLFHIGDIPHDGTNHAAQYGRRGIRWNAVYPGMVLSAGALKYVPQPYLDAVYEQITTVRMGIPDDIGYAVAFLATDAAGYINGEAINVDGRSRRRT